MERHLINLKVNGELHRLEVESRETLLQVLRDRLDLTGVKEGCGRGECGACNVLVNGRPMNACLIFAAAVQDQEILTIEGLSDGETLHPLQKSFVESGAIQCGFCTPGMILNTYSLLLRNPEPTREEIIEGMEYNLCRCGAHIRIIRAIESAAQEMKGAR